jgi:cell division protein FtsW (lipid II flippase)
VALTSTRPARRPPLLPPYRRGPKPRRRTELGLLILGTVIIGAFYVLASLGANSKIPPHIVPFLAVVLALAFALHLANRWLVPNAHAVVLPIVALLNGIGYVVIVRWNPQEAHYQAAWVAIGVVAYVVTLLVVRRSRDLDRYRYLLLLFGALLMLAPLVPGIGEDINGARLWVHFGTVLAFQPIEFAKIFLCIFFASYFAEKKELLSIPTARVGDRLVVDPRPLVPILVAWGFAMVVIGLENDIGFAMLMFILFLGLLWISTGRFGYLVIGIVLFAVGAYVAAHVFHQVHGRVEIWLDPWNSSVYGAGQLKQGWYSIAAGGVGGTGLGEGVSGVWVPFITSDMIFAGIAEELGFLGASAVVIAFLLVCGAGLRIAQTARSEFSKLVATGLTIILGFQALFIMAGILRLLPLTGITLPFVAYGGSSLVANYILIALLMRISDEGAVSYLEPSDTDYVVAS